MSKVDLIYAGVAGAALGGVLGPLLFPMAAGMKTASLVTSIACSGALAYAHQSGLIDRARQEDAETRESHREVRRQKQISWELRETKRCEVEDLKEILLMLDDLSPFEQRHFLKELDLLELMPVYQESRMLKMAEAEPTQTIETAAEPIFNDGELELPEPSGIVMPDRVFFPVVDLAHELAQADRQLVEVSCPGGGKTRFQIAFAAAVYDRSKGQSQCIVIDAKGSPFAKLGVKHYLHCNEPEQIPLAWALLHSAIEIMISRQNRRTAVGGEYKAGQEPQELLIILGELNDLLELAVQYDSQHKTDYSDRMILGVSRIFRQGREDKVRILADMHSFNAGDLKAKKQKMSAAMFSNAAKLALSRNGDATVIDKFLSYYAQASDEAVKEARMKLDEYQSECPNKSIPLVATSLGGLRIVQLPAVELNSLYRDWKPIDFKRVGQDEPSASFDAEYEQEHGIDPDVEIALDEEEDFWADEPQDKPKSQPNSKPSSIPNNSPLAILVAQLKQWITTLPTSPTDSQLRAKLLELTGQNFSQDAIAGLKQELGL